MGGSPAVAADRMGRSDPGSATTPPDPEYRDDPATPAPTRLGRYVLLALLDILAYEAPPIDAGVEEALDEYVARRKSGMADEWY